MLAQFFKGIDAGYLFKTAVVRKVVPSAGNGLLTAQATITAAIESPLYGGVSAHAPGHFSLTGDLPVGRDAFARKSKGRHGQSWPPPSPGSGAACGLIPMNSHFYSGRTSMALINA